MQIDSGQMHCLCEPELLSEALALHLPVSAAAAAAAAVVAARVDLALVDAGKTLSVQALLCGQKHLQLWSQEPSPRNSLQGRYQPKGEGARALQQQHQPLLPLLLHPRALPELQQLLAQSQTHLPELQPKLWAWFCAEPPLQPLHLPDASGVAGALFSPLPPALRIVLLPP